MNLAGRAERMEKEKTSHNGSWGATAPVPAHSNKGKDEKKCQDVGKDKATGLGDQEDVRSEEREEEERTTVLNVNGMDREEGFLPRRLLVPSSPAPYAHKALPAGRSTE